MSPAPTRTTTDPSSTNQLPSQRSPGFGVVGALLGISLSAGVCKFQIIFPDSGF
ncbi:MAG: hypothetical protein MIO93_02525 [ANME-2 cluster archaeon]|nr:hypothetical protein [ANME-2 cluster archaeon]